MGTQHPNRAPYFSQGGFDVRLVHMRHLPCSSHEPVIMCGQIIDKALLQVPI
jgi:hypothetical protein